MTATTATTEHLRLPEAALCLSAHAITPTVAVGLFTGGLVVAPFPATLSASPAKVTHPFESPCRATSFFPSSTQLLASTSTKASDGNILLFDSASDKALHSYTLKTSADADSPTATVFTPISSTLVLAGDDNGGLHLLDMRVPERPCASVLDQADYISAIHPAEAFGTSAILASSGDGTLCAYDMRTGPHARLKLQYATDTFQDDLLSMTVLPEVNCAIAGTLAGAINVYSLSLLDKENDMDEAKHVERFFGHPECVNAVLPVGEDGLALTASTDGVVRIIDVGAKALVGVLDYAKEASAANNVRKRKKKQDEADAWPIESMVSVAGLPRPAFALLGHDDLIRFCDGSLLVDDDEASHLKGSNKVADTACRIEQSQREAEELESKRQVQQSRKKKKKRRELFEKPTKGPATNHFFSDL